MSRNRTITYMIDEDTGLVMSRVFDEIAVPVLDFGHMKPENGFETIYNLEKMDLSVLYHTNVIHTRKIPVVIKNEHRKFWGMKPVSK